MNRYTLIIVNWNSWDMLSRCLEKLDSQTFQNFNALVIDNASGQPAPAGLLAKHPRVTLVQNQINLGFAAANNQAIKLLGDTEWVVMLNPDAFPEPDWLERLVEAARENPDYSMFGSRQLMDANHLLLDGEGDTYHISGLPWREGHGRQMKYAQNEPRDIFALRRSRALS